MVNQEKLSDSVMATVQEKSEFARPDGAGAMISPEESARYTADMLESLRKLAAHQGQPILAHLLELAQAEARILIRTSVEARA